MFSPVANNGVAVLDYRRNCALIDQPNHLVQASGVDRCPYVIVIAIAIQIVFHEEKHKTRICHLNPVLSAAVRILKTRI